MNILDMYDSITIINGNSIKDTVITAIALIPVIPGGVIMAAKYMKKVKIIRNKYYNFKNHATRINNMYGIEVFRK